nr:MAG TPA: PORTAL PROTEIN [Caudoviricetes sp.]
MQGTGFPLFANVETAEKKRIKDLSHTALISLIVEYTAQQLVVEGVSDTEGDQPQIFEPFVRNGLPSRQLALHSSVLTNGAAFGLAIPGDLRAGGDPSHAFIGAFGMERMGAIYSDTVLDEFPEWAYLRGNRAGTDTFMLWDNEFQYEAVNDGSGWQLTSDPLFHGMGKTPVVKLTNNEDLNGVATGEPMKYRQDVQRMGKTVDDRLRIQHYNSWRVKYAIKLSDHLTEEEEKKVRLKLEQEDILLGFEDTEFGTLDQTDLGPMIAAQETDRDTLAAVSQTPVWAFNGGSMVNLSADALIEAKSGNRQKVGAVQRSLNRPYCNWFRLAALAENRLADAQNFGLVPTWLDMGSLSLSAAADGLGKLAVSLGVPVEELWEYIPNVPLAKVQAWREKLSVGNADLGALVEARRGTNSPGV